MGEIAAAEENCFVLFILVQENMYFHALPQVVPEYGHKGEFCSGSSYGEKLENSTNIRTMSCRIEGYFLSLEQPIKCILKGCGPYILARPGNRAPAPDVLENQIRM